MDLKATVAAGYRNRLILIAAGALLYAAWAYYDATVRYQDQLLVWEAYQTLIEEKPKTYHEEWPEVAEQNGWKTATPTERTQGDITTQWVQFFIVFPIGSYCLVSLLLWSRRFVGADQDKLYAQGGAEVPFNQITKIDATRWDAKGIARVSYDTGQGEKTIVLDDWKFEREPTDQIFDRLTDAVDEEVVVGLSSGADAPQPEAPEATG